MEKLIYIEFGSVDWRIPALQLLEPDIIGKANKASIPNYDPDDVAQELRLRLWSSFGKYDPEKYQIRTWANTVMNNHLHNLHYKYTKTQKRKDYLCEPIDKLSL